MGDCESSVRRNYLRLLRVPPTVSSASGVAGIKSRTGFSLSWHGMYLPYSRPGGRFFSGLDRLKPVLLPPPAVGGDR